MTVTCDRVRVPARQGGVLAGLGPGRLASVLLPASVAARWMCVTWSEWFAASAFA